MKTATKIFVILLAISLVISSSDVFSQVLKKPKFGFSIAPNVGWMKPDAKDYESDGALFGFSWGFISEFPMAENYYFTTGFNIDLNNGKLKYPEKVADATGTMYRRYNLKYLEIPLIMKLRAPIASGPVFYAQLGFGAGMRIDAKSEGRFVSSTGQTTVFDKEKFTEEVNLLKASLLIGLGIEYPVGASSKAIAGFMFNNGFTNVLKGTNLANPSVEHNAASNFIEMKLGFLF